MNWPTKKLGEVLDVFSGFAFNSTYFNESEGIPIVRIRDLKRGKTKTRYSGEYDERFLINNGDILVGMDGNFNCIIWEGGRALLNQRVCKIHDFNGILAKYAFYALKVYLEGVEEKTSFTTVKHLSAKDIKNLEIPVPPLSEQKKIVAKIEELTGKIKEAKELRAQAQQDIADLLPAALHQIFSVQAEEAGWNEVKINNVAHVVGGGTPSTAVADYWGNDYYLITPKDLGKLSNIDLSRGERKISEEGLKNSSAKLLPVGSVIFSTRAPIGYVAINSIELTTNQGCRSFICGDDLINRFLAYYLMFSIRSIRNIAGGSTFAEIAGSKLGQYKIPLPSIEKQKEIVEYLDSLSEKTKQIQDLQTQTATDFDELEQSILHKAFQGELV
jgi:type I restriction enzyme S subunit